MRIFISHDTVYHYDRPARGVIQLLRLTPRNHEGQEVIRWHIDVSQDCQLHVSEDAFGNCCHVFSTTGEFSALELRVEGEIQTFDTHGMIRGTVERFPPALFMRDTDLTTPSDALHDLARQTQAAGADTLQRLHHLQGTLHQNMIFDTDPTQPTTTAAQAFALGRGVCQDITHIFLTCARLLDIPARYVSGYFHRADGIVQQDAGHAWAEAFIEDLGWVGFDPTNGICTTDAHVRMAIGLDYLGASPVRGARLGGGHEKLAVAVHVDQAARQMQD